MSETSASRDAPGLVYRLLRMGLWLFGGGALVGTVFVFSFYMAMRSEMRSTEVQVPDLTGQTLEAAGSSVQPLELVLEVVDQRHDPTVASGHVLQQTPPGGISVRRGRKIKLVVSLGDRVLEVPDLVGRAARAVEIGLRRDGFTPGYEVRVSSGAVPRGTVLSQVPPSGSPAVPNARVHRLVSNGPVPVAWIMPDLDGRARPEVEAWARRAGFRVAIRSVRVGGRATGTIVGQYPLSGYPVREGDVIELTIAR